MVVDFMPSLQFFPLACSLLIFYNICSFVHTTSLLNKWERAISEHAFPTLCAVTASSRFSFPLSKHTGKFLLILALRQTSSKQMIKPKPFPSPMIGSTNWINSSCSHTSHGMQHGQLNSTFTTKAMRSFARVRASPPAAELSCDTGPPIPTQQTAGPAWLLPGFPPFSCEEPLPRACSSAGLSRHQGPSCPLALTLTPAKGGAALQTSTVPGTYTAPSVSGFIRHLPCPSCLLKAPPYSFSTCISSIFIIQQTAHYLQSHSPLSTPQPEGSWEHLRTPRTWESQPRNSQEHGTQPPEVMHTLVNTKQNLFSQFSAMKAKF